MAESDLADSRLDDNTKSLGLLSHFPAEIRNQIYSEALPSDINLHPYQYSRSNRGPDIALLFVNRKLNTEATSILYSNSTFNLTTGPDLYRFFSTTTPRGAEITKNAHLNRYLIKKMRISFNAQPSSLLEVVQRNTSLWNMPAFQASTEARGMEIAHKFNLDQALSSWSDATVAYRALAQRGMLREIILDVDNAFCAQGCCRLHGRALPSLYDVRSNNLGVTVEGRLTPKEDRMVRQRYNPLEQKLLFGREASD